MFDITKYAPAIKESNSGETISCNGVSPLEHQVEVSVRSKNLIPFPYNNTSKTTNGVTFTVNDDGSITLNGTPTATCVFYLYINDATQSLLQKGNTYTISLLDAPSYWTMYLNTNVREIGSASWNDSIAATNASVSTSFVCTKDYQGFQLYLVITTDIGTLENVTVYPQLELGSTATDYTPYIPDLSAVTVSRYGKNLWTNEERTWNQHFTIVNEDINSITAIANTETKPSAVPVFEWTHKDYKKWGNKIRVSFDYEFFNSVSSEFRPNEFMVLARKDGTMTHPLISKLGGDTTSKQHFSATVTIDTSIDYEFIRFGFYGSVLPTDSFKDYRVELSNIQLELGSTATDYEPYKEPLTAIADADGTLNGLTSISPNMTLVSDTEGTIIDCTYNKSTKAYVDDIVSSLQTATLEVVE